MAAMLSAHHTGSGGAMMEQRMSDDVTRYAIFAGPDSRENLSGWIFTDAGAAERARCAYPRGAVIALLPDAAMAASLELAGQQNNGWTWSPDGSGYLREAADA